jgi:signal transduction histidine kinase
LSHYVDGKFEVLNTSNGLPSNFVMGLVEIRDGSLWAGVDYGGPLLRIKDGKVTAYRNGFHGTPALYEDEHGVLWIGNRGSLKTWDGSKFKQFTTRNGLSDDDIDAICGDGQGGVWIGTSRGLTRWQAGEFRNLATNSFRLNVFILSLYQDADQTLWIGTRGKGLLRYRNGVVYGFTRNSGLFSDSIYAILEDSHTNLWLNSSRGIFRMSKRQLEAVAAGTEAGVTSISYGRSDGILASGQYNDATQPAACKDTQGRLWFRTTQGVTMIDPDKLTGNTRPPPVVIQKIIANNKVVATQALGVEAPVSISIPPGNGALEIYYAALSYCAPDKNRYRYKLNGIDAGWVDAGNQRIAKYNNLRPGHYRFRVAACNNDGVWNTQGQSVELIFEPYFWQTWWFLCLLGAAATGIVGGTARYVTRRRMQRKLDQLEKQRAIERERARIARDVHDELGAKLTSISFLGSIASRSSEDPEEIKKQVEQMSASAREAVASLHEIVWAVDPVNDSLEGLIGHISNQVGELFGNSSMHCKVKVPETIPDVRLSASVRHNLFLAAIEAANNAAKHSKATQVLIQISTSRDELEITVSDDGCGCEINPANDHPRDKTTRPGNGLANMRKRLGSIGGTSHFTSAAGRGTIIHFVVPLKPVVGLAL